MPRPPRRNAWLLLSLAAALLALFALVTPYAVMQPFAAQSSDALQLALWVVRATPWLVVAAAIAAVVALVRAWPGERWTRYLRRGAASLAALVVVLAGLGAQVNLFERLFAPMSAPEYVALGEAGLADDDVLITVKIADATRAYPVRVMAYHHVLNDELAGAPIVVTY